MSPVAFIKSPLVWLKALSRYSVTMITAPNFAFELCVGMYFPSIGTLRSRHVPDSHRSVIMNLFGIPLNLLVISVFLSIRRLGVSGALRVATGALGLATSAAAALVYLTRDAATAE